MDSLVAGALTGMDAIYVHVVRHKVSFLSGVGPTSEKAKQEEEGEEKRQPAVGLQWTFSSAFCAAAFMCLTNPSKKCCHLLV